MCRKKLQSQTQSRFQFFLNLQQHKVGIYTNRFFPLAAPGFGRQKQIKNDKTRLHYSRMRTARLFTLSQHALRKGVSVHGGVCLGDVCSEGGVY